MVAALSPEIPAPALTGRILEWRENALGAGWDLELDAVVWIDVARLDALWARTDQYVSPGGVRGAQDDRYARVGRFIATRAPINMLFVGIDDDVVAFTDGRHRFAWLRDHGLRALPVQCAPETAPILERLAGSAERRSVLPGLF